VLVEEIQKDPFCQIPKKVSSKLTLGSVWLRFSS